MTLIDLLRQRRATLRQHRQNASFGRLLDDAMQTNPSLASELVAIQRRR